MGYTAKEWGYFLAYAKETCGNHWTGPANVWFSDVLRRFSGAGPSSTPRGLAVPCHL
jgi:hypothetical protein